MVTNTHAYQLFRCLLATGLLLINIGSVPAQAPVVENEIRTQPLKDWLGEMRNLYSQGLLNLREYAELTIDARVAADCGLTDIAISEKSGNWRITELSGRMTKALSESHLAAYLTDVRKQSGGGCEAVPIQITILLIQGGMSGDFRYPVRSEERARELAKGYNVMLDVAEKLRHGHPGPKFFQNIHVSREGQQLRFHLALSSELITEILRTPPTSK